MTFLLITLQAEYVTSNQLDKITKLSGIYAYFIKKYLERANIKVICIEFKKKLNNIPEANNCLITVNRGVSCLHLNNYNILRRKIKNKIMTISENSKFVGQEDILFFINGKTKSKCIKTSFLVDLEVFKPEKELDKLIIIVENEKLVNNLELDKTDFIINSLLEFKNVSSKNIQIIYKGKKSFYEINDLIDYELAYIDENDSENILKIGYDKIIEYYNKANIFVNTHHKSFGLSIFEYAMSGTLIVTFENFIKNSYINLFRNHIITKEQVESNNIDWNEIINKIDIKESIKKVKKFTYNNIVNKIINVINFQPKVAICFSGAIRNFDRCIPSIQKYFLNNFKNKDIFLHLWTFDKDENNNLTTNFKWRNSSTSAEKIIDILKPVSYQIDNYNSDWEQQIISNSGIDLDKFDTLDEKNYGINCCSMYWKIFKCFELMNEYSLKNNINYDLIIRARLDFIWEDHIYSENFQIINNVINLIKDRYATHSNLITNDKFFAGNYEIMKKMCNIFWELSTFQKNLIKLDGQVINEFFILQNKFDHNWLGHKDTYYKHINRHDIILNNISVHINIIQNKICNEIIYSLLDNGYIVSNLNNNTNNYNLLFDNYNDNIINPDIVISMVDNIIQMNIFTKEFKLIFSDNLILTIIDNPNYLIDFIKSIIINNSNEIPLEYNFINIKQIVDIKENEKIVYKYIDRGYYDSSIITKDINDNFIINFNNNHISVLRNTFKLENIILYYENGFLPIN